MRSLSKTLISIVILLVLTIYTNGCGDDGDNKSEGNSFSGSIEGTGAPGSVSNSSKESQEGMFGATITGNIIYFYIITSQDPTNAFLITGEIATSDENKLPGSFSIDASTVTVSMTKMATSTIYNAISGTVKIENCPENSIGSLLKGEFVNVQLSNASGNGETLTLNGKFTLLVYSIASYGLVCSGSPTTDGDTDICEFNEEGPCTGPCCPYLSCFNNCFLTNCFSQCMTPGVIQCAQCISNCDQQCQPQITTECQPKLDDLKECIDTNNCEYIGDDCSIQFCCPEMKEAFQP